MIHWEKHKNIDQSHLSISINTTNSIRVMNQKIQIFSLLIDRSNAPVDSRAMQQPRSS